MDPVLIVAGELIQRLIEDLRQGGGTLSGDDWARIDDVRSQLAASGDSAELAMAAVMFDVMAAFAISQYRSPQELLTVANGVLARVEGRTEEEWAPIKAWAYELVAQAHHRSDDPERALEMWSKAVATDPSCLERVQPGRTSALFDCGRIDEAFDILERSADAARMEGNDRHLTVLLNNLAALNNAAGRSARALEHAEQGLTVARRVGDRIGIVSALNSHGQALAALGQAEMALEGMAEALAEARRLGMPDLIAKVQGDYGFVFLSLGRLDEAEDAFEESLRAAEACGDVKAAATARHNLSVVKSRRAGDAYSDDAGPHPLRRLGAELEFNRGNDADARGDSDAAVRHWEAAVANGAASIDLRRAALNNLLKAAFNNDDAVRIHDVTVRLTALADQLEGPQRIEALRAAAAGLRHARHDERSAELLAAALQLAEEEEDHFAKAAVLRDLAKTRARLLDDVGAISAYERALGAMQVAQNAPGALSAYERAIGAVVQKDESLYAWCLYEIAMCHTRLGQRREAIAATEAALALVGVTDAPAVAAFQDVLATMKDADRWMGFRLAALHDRTLKTGRTL